MKQFGFIFLSPGVFLPTMGFLLILTLIALLLLFRREKDVGEPSAPLGETEKRFHARGEEREVYQRMYGDQFSPYANSEGIYVSRSLPVNESEFETAETYDLATLIQKEGKSPGKQVPIRKSETTFGNGELSDVVISDPGVSKLHARIRKIKNRFVLYDLISDGGTYLNGKKILRPRVLYDFDEISLEKRCTFFGLVRISTFPIHSLSLKIDQSGRKEPISRRWKFKRISFLFSRNKSNPQIPKEFLSGSIRIQ